MEKYDLVRRDGSNFIVPPRTVDFASVKEKIKSLLETYWKFDNQKVIVEWTDNPEAYELKHSSLYGSRAVTFRKPKKVEIPEGRNLKSFVHEFGHILGFKDKYVTTFNRDACNYTEEVYHADVMSYTSSGVVLKYHFDELNRVYR